MCVFYDPMVVKQCTEDDAEEINDKEKVNFCEWFKPAVGAFDAVGASKAEKAKADLDALFSDGLSDSAGKDSASQAAEDLFK